MVTLGSCGSACDRLRLVVLFPVFHFISFHFILFYFISFFTLTVSLPETVPR